MGLEGNEIANSLAVALCATALSRGGEWEGRAPSCRGPGLGTGVGIVPLVSSGEGSDTMMEFGFHAAKGESLDEVDTASRASGSSEASRYAARQDHSLYASLVSKYSRGALPTKCKGE